MRKNPDRNYAPLLVVNVARTLLLLLPLVLATPVKALCYADPGTGAFIYQAAYAAFLGGTFYLRRLLDRFSRRRPQTIEPQRPLTATTTPGEER
jgi:hypothetical protein